MEFVGIGAWIIGMFVNGMIASEKGRSVASTVVMSLILSPVAVWAYLVAVPAKE